MSATNNGVTQFPTYYIWGVAIPHGSPVQFAYNGKSRAGRLEGCGNDLINVRTEDGHRSFTLSKIEGWAVVSN